MRISDWSSDVCSSDLKVRRLPLPRGETDIFHDRLCDDQIVDSPEPVLRLGHPLAEPLGVQRVLVGIERRQRSEEHTSELQSLMRISYAVFCLKKKNAKYKVAIHDNYHTPETRSNHI